jgi:hypothetical protein
LLGRLAEPTATAKSEAADTKCLEPDPNLIRPSQAAPSRKPGVIMIHSSWMPKAIAMVALAAGLSGCGAADLISNGLSYTRAVEADLEQATGIKPEVGFNWRNGSFQSVTVTFPRLQTGRPLGELADTVREVVAKEFKQTPARIVLAFSLEK